MNTLAENYYKEVDRKFGNNNNDYTLSSLEVAEMIGKEHKELLRDIRRYFKQLNNINQNKVGVQIAPSDFFQETTYISEQNKELPCYNVTRKGCEFIANKLTGQKGTEFTARYVNRFHELEEGNITNTLIKTLNAISESMTIMRNDIDSRLSKLEQSHCNRYLLETQYPSAWYKKMAPKYKLLMEYFDCTRKELYSSIYKELEDTYDVDINQIYEDYCYENRLSKDQCYPMDAIEHNTRLREAVTLLIDSSLVKYGLQTEEQVRNFKRETLFDRVPA